MKEYEKVTVAKRETHRQQEPARERERVCEERERQTSDHRRAVHVFETGHGQPVAGVRVCPRGQARVDRRPYLRVWERLD